ncbi:hypothetical protein KSF78_0008833 [Schistosoma japonicum]|nr:hypothetical protein KSF78_0008833 [Schistosoma japonicum]
MTGRVNDHRLFGQPTKITGLLIDEYSAHQQIGMNKDSTSINTMPEIFILDSFSFSSSQLEMKPSIKLLRRTGRSNEYRFILFSNVDNDQNKRTNQEGQVKNSYKVGQVNKSVKVQFYNKYILVFFLDSFYHHQQQLQGFIKSVFSIHQYNIFEHSAIYHTSIKYYSRESISPTRETDIIMLINKDLMTSGHFNACCRPNGLKTTAIRLLHCDYDLRCLIANGRVKMLLNYISSAHWIQPTGIITLYANYHLHIINKQCCHKNCHCFELLFK